MNVSARRLLDLAFPDEVAAALTTWEVPARLVVEITESTIMADPTHAPEILGLRDEMGVQLAIDDFGTGYSSMAYLKSLPVHELKVERSFVAQMTSNSSDAVIVHSTIDLGRNLGLRVVADRQAHARRRPHPMAHPSPPPGADTSDPPSALRLAARVIGVHLRSMPRG